MPQQLRPAALGSAYASDELGVAGGVPLEVEASAVHSDQVCALPVLGIFLLHVHTDFHSQPSLPFRPSFV